MHKPFLPIAIIALIFGLFSTPAQSFQDEAADHADSHQQEEHKYTNRLVDETSPYLLQHAHNPVQWYPWGEEALNKAKASSRLFEIYSKSHARNERDQRQLLLRLEEALS